MKETQITKIMFFLPTLGVGGGERVVSELSLHLPDSIERSITLFQNHVSYPYKGRLFFLDIPIANPLLQKIYYFFVAMWHFKKILKKEKPDYVISFGAPANIINLLSYKKTMIRVDNFMSSASGGIYRLLIKLLYNRAPQIVCVSKASAKDLIDNFGIKKEKIKVIYNPLDVAEIQRLSLEPLDPEHAKIFESPVVITMGRLSRQKGQWHLIRAFREVKSTVKNAKLVILGTGELDPELKQQAEDSGLQNDIHFLGWQDNPFKFLVKARVFALSSLWEGLPYVLLEAMACGLPVVSVDCKSGPREILAPDTDISKEANGIELAKYGILTPPVDGKKYAAKDPLTKSEEALQRAIIRVLTDEALAKSLSLKSQQRAQDFDVKSIIKEWDFLGK